MIKFLLGIFCGFIFGVILITILVAGKEDNNEKN